MCQGSTRKLAQLPYRPLCAEVIGFRRLCDLEKQRLELGRWLSREGLAWQVEEPQFDPKAYVLKPDVVTQVYKSSSGEVETGQLVWPNQGVSSQGDILSEKHLMDGT